MSEPTQIASDPESIPLPDVLLLPAEYFFIEKVEVPPALASTELADFAELSMEAIAPFPLEQLRWGFLTAPDGQHLLIYAALKDRLKRAGYDDLETYTWVLPVFATLHGARFTEPTEIILLGDNFDTACHHPGGDALPENIRNLPRSDATPVASTLPPSDATPVASTQRSNTLQLRLKLLSVELSEKGLPRFQFETLGKAPANGHWSPLEPDEATLWQADIRPSDFKTVERNARRTTGLVTRVMGYAAIFAILLVLLEGLLFVGQLWLNTRTAKIEAQTTSVRRVEDKHSLLNKLEQVAQNELRPIAILESANQIRIDLGKTGIEYDEVVIEEGNRLTIEGKANTINELNAYIDSLGVSGDFQLVGSPKQVTRSGKTTFTLTLDYTHSEPAESVAPPLAAASESEATTEANRTEGSVQP